MSINHSIDYYDQTFDYPEINLIRTNETQGLFECSFIKETMNDVHTNVSLVQTYIASCLAQKDIALNKISSIKKTQQETREHARLWSTELAPKISAIYTDVTGFCSLAGDEKEGFWEDLITAAHQINNNNDENISTFKEIIQVFKEDIEERKNKTTELTDNLSAFKSYLEEDNRHFQVIISEAQQIYSGSGGEIETINSNIKAIKSAIDINIGIIAGGSIAVVGGIIMIGVGTIGTVMTGGAAAKLVVSGVITSVGGVSAIAIASKDLIEKQKGYGFALQELAKLEGEVAALKNVEDHFSGLKDKNENAHKAVESMRQGWIVLHNNFDELENSIHKIDTDKRILLINRLKTTKKNFDNLSIQAQNMQKNSILKVQITPDIMSNLGLAKTFYSFPVYSLCTKRLVKSTPSLLELPELVELVT